MKILAIDPGPVESCYCLIDADPFVFHYARMAENDELRRTLGSFSPDVSALVIEGVESYGMAVGREVFDTVFWIGRFFERAFLGKLPPHIIYRKTVKTTICHTTSANDGNIRTRLMDVFGGKAAKGTIKQKGPIYGLSGHGWAALALALTYRETRGLGSVDDLAAQYARTDGKEADRRDTSRSHESLSPLQID